MSDERTPKDQYGNLMTAEEMRTRYTDTWSIFQGEDAKREEFDAWLRSERARAWDEGWDANDAGPARHNPYE